MKIRVYSPEFPFPVVSGSAQVIHDQLRVLVELGHEVELVTWRDKPIDVETRRQAMIARTPSLKSVTLVSFANPKSRMKETRTERALRTLLSLNDELSSPEIHYYCPSTDRRAQLARADLGIYHYSFAYAWLARSNGPNPESRIAVHFHNLESELALERVRPGSPTSLIHRTNARKLSTHESDLGTLADELWFVSPTDLTRHVPRGNASRKLVSPTFDPHVRERRLGRWKMRPASRDVVFGFLGTLEFGPNQSSLRWILQELTPTLRARGFRGRIRVVGKNAPPELLTAMREARDLIQYDGFVEDLEEFWASLSFLLVPHITGSGVRIKLLDAVASGMPVIANTGAIERLAPALQRFEGILRLEDAAAWAERIMAETPHQTREALENIPFPDSLLTQPVYLELPHAPCT